MSLFSCTINNFQVTPYVRMTQKGKFVKPRAQAYLGNQDALAWEFRRAHRQVDPINGELELSFTVHLPHERLVDADNILKALQDALQKSGVITNDCQIKGYGKSRLYQDGQARVIVVLDVL